nr:MAG TPA: Large Terminase [Caudoviricetes sp.]
MRDRATQYAEDVVAGRVVAGELQRLACKRHLDDLQRQDTPGFAYHWDWDTAENGVIGFAEKLTLSEGYNARPLELEPFQAFVLGSLYGWLDSRGFRRYRLSYIEMARQNGKSLLNGINAAYLGNFGGYFNGQLYTAATKLDQAKIVLKEVEKFISADPELAELYRPRMYKSEIECLLTDSTIRALSQDTSRIDGFRPLFASVDEYHAHKTNQMLKLLEDGGRDMAETLVSVITTAGFDLNGPCYELHRMAEQVLRGSTVRESMFCLIFTLDKDDDPWDSANWIKAGPHACATPEGVARLRETAEAARTTGGNDLRNFWTKHLNIWVQQRDDQFAVDEDIRACGGRGLETFLRDHPDIRDCIVGLDLSSGGDLTTVHLEFDRPGGVYWYSHSYIPRGRLMEHISTDLAPYDVWERQLLLTATGGLGTYKNDYHQIIADLDALRQRHGLRYRMICYDPHNADGFLAELEALGAPVIQVTQSARNLSAATEDVQLMLREHRVEYDAENDLLRWSLANAVTVSNSFGEIKIDKDPRRQTRRIDPCDAAIDAHWGSMQQPPELVDVSAALDDYLKMMHWG